MNQGFQEKQQNPQVQALEHMPEIQGTSQQHIYLIKFLGATKILKFMKRKGEKK